MDRVSCLETLKELRSLKQRPNQSVEDFNLLMVQHRIQLERLLYVSVPDMSAQVNSYMADLHADVTETIQTHADLQ